MIPDLPGWHRSYRGDTVLLTSGEGRIGYRERVRPLRAFSTIVGDLMARHPECERPAITTKKLITDEGEFGALATIATEIRGAPAQRDVGVVFGDDFYAMVSGLTLVPAAFARVTAAVHALVLTDSHRLGVRRRRFLYDPPKGWHALARGFQAHYYSPGYPLDGASLRISPADPGEASIEALMEAMMERRIARGFVVDHLSAPDPISSANGLHGGAWELIGREPGEPRHFEDLVIFKDERYVYPLSLICSSSEKRTGHRQTFVEVVRSAWPIPSPPKKASSDAALAHWLR